ncbi:multi antimicrobial extrusion protein [Bacteroides reticulotermitis JCM 10512]|uniref:Multidrug export protein MepA n=2 Tax=Bacteroides reticulotermitis TaxID=1133319 RepID=W4UWM5_9BACE|nr:multi antimicrobial extrusion protein [Bacteroides reticulotermitis JCM 10512]
MYLCALKEKNMSQQKTPTALGTEKIGKLLMQYAIPAIIAMTASSLYNMVDSIFIGHGVGALAISGLALTFPLMNLGAAFGSLVGVGASTLISVKLGQKDYGTAQKILGNVLILNLIIGISFTLLVLPFLDPILYFFGGSDETVKYAREFMQIILLGNVVTHLYLGLNAVLRASGHPQKAMIATITTVVINVLLAPLFIFVFDWGIRGAAAATVCAQLIALLWQFHFFSRKDELIRLQKGIYRLERKIVTDSLAIGMAPFLMNMASCFIVILINQGLKKYGGDLAIGAFGIVNRIVFVFIMIVLGLNQGMQPIAGYNFGAKLYPRVTRVLKETIRYATVITTIGFLIGMFIPEMVSAIFTSDPELIAISSKGFRLVVLFFPIVGFQMVASNFFQSIGMANKAIFLSLTRQMLFLVPCLLILPHYYGQLGVWVSMPVADLAASVVSGAMLWWQFRQFKKAEAAR